jgi:RNA polymerase sporulation-specific sigma factor
MGIILLFFLPIGILLHTNDGSDDMGYNGKVEISGVNTSHLTVLKRDEAKALFLKAKEGDEEARQKLIQGNLRLVLSVIKKFENRNENMDDLFQVGCIGLIKGIDHFDVTLNVLPSTYLVPMIVGEIRRYLRDNSTIRVSRSMRDTAYKVLQAKEQFIGRHQKEPTVDDLAKELNLPRQDIIFALDAILDPVSLYEPVYSDGGDALYVMDQVQDKKNTDDLWLEQIALKEAISRLSERERHILSLRFYQGKTQMEVSAEVGISQAQVSRLEKNALASIKKQM